MTKPKITVTTTAAWQQAGDVAWEVEIRPGGTIMIFNYRNSDILTFQPADAKWLAVHLQLAVDWLARNSVQEVLTDETE